MLTSLDKLDHAAVVGGGAHRAEISVALPPKRDSYARTPSEHLWGAKTRVRLGQSTGLQAEPNKRTPHRPSKGRFSRVTPNYSVRSLGRVFGTHKDLNLLRATRPREQPHQREQIAHHQIHERPVQKQPEGCQNSDSGREPGF